MGKSTGHEKLVSIRQIAPSIGLPEAITLSEDGKVQKLFGPELEGTLGAIGFSWRFTVSVKSNSQTSQFRFVKPLQHSSFFPLFSTSAVRTT